METDGKEDGDTRCHKQGEVVAEITQLTTRRTQVTISLTVMITMMMMNWKPTTSRTELASFVQPMLAHHSINYLWAFPRHT